MNNIVDGDVVTISNGCDKLSTFSSKNMQYNVAMIKHFSPKQDLTLVDQHRGRQTFTVKTASHSPASSH